MISKALEIRDRGTFIAALAVSTAAANNGQYYLLRRCGYSAKGDGDSILLTRLDGGGKCCSDCYDWGDRTWKVAHNYIAEHFEELSDGDVVDVEFILGESTERKLSERITERA